MHHCTLSSLISVMCGEVIYNCVSHGHQIRLIFVIVKILIIFKGFSLLMTSLEFILSFWKYIYEYRVFKSLKSSSKLPTGDN